MKAIGMEDENEKADQKAEDLAAGLLEQAARIGNVNPLGMSRKTGRYRISGLVCWEDDQSPVEGLTLGLCGTESKTDSEGKFTFVVEKK
jgi:hypothetical protein